ncbi:tRNA preQ1(34) S-adenosylmethionine ribosyltransferase-isomerase QueA [Hydrogenobaculum sp.]|nr:MAG: tRNA preQ1(34) S-adenosylmethionine ribosyltransferase-isomerase QueA [Hydrogenobaculum sp.]
MDISLFDYELPERLIAKYPVNPRHSAKLMVLDRKNNTITHSTFWHIDEFLEEGDLLVFNDTKVLPARLLGKKKGIEHSSVEILLLRHLENEKWEALVGGKNIKPGLTISISDDFEVTIESQIEKSKFLVLLKAKNQTQIDAINKYGKIPIPPYLERDEEPIDREFYQTVFAKKEFSVAAPTASLHFSEELLEKLKKKVNIDFITLHVSYGTFKPVTVKNIEEHKVDEEYIEVREALIKNIQKTKEMGKKVIAVGTTVTRALETAVDRPYFGFTDLYIKPGFKFKVLDGLITNFHLPKSSLLILVSAFCEMKNPNGREFILKAYKEAIKNEYRFYSYGDGMLIL